MSMINTSKCVRCGKAVDAQGRCLACGVLQGYEGTPKKQAAVANSSATRVAYLVNPINNERFSLTQSVSKIGRDQTNSVSLDEDHYISRHHAWILQLHGAYWVEDLGSTNGTFLNGENISDRKQIFSGDRITFGATELVFFIE